MFLMMIVASKLSAIKCPPQLNGPKVITVGGKTATCDFHVFKSHPNWAANLRTRFKLEL